MPAQFPLRAFSNNSIARVNLNATLNTAVTNAESSSKLNISSVIYPTPNITDTSNVTTGYLANTNQTIALRGSGFNANIKIWLNGNLTPNITRTNVNYVSFNTASVIGSSGSYPLYIRNEDDNMTFEFYPGLTFVDEPVYQGTQKAYMLAGLNVPAAFTFNIDSFPFATYSVTNAIASLGKNPGYPGRGNHSLTHGYDASNGTIERFPFATNQNSTNIGVGFPGKTGEVGNTNAGVKGYTGGGTPTTGSQQTFSFPFATNVNATPVILLNVARYGCSQQNSPTHGYIASGYPGSPTVIDKFSFSTNVTATNMGSLPLGSYYATGQSSSTHGYVSGGGPGIAPIGYVHARIDRFPFATNQNATNIGSLVVARRAGGFFSTPTHGWIYGGYGGPPTNRYSYGGYIGRFSFASGGESAVTTAAPRRSGVGSCHV